MNLKFIAFILVGILWGSQLYAQEEISFLKKYSVEIAIDPANENYTDLLELKKYIGDSRIVLLGEQSHGDGTTFSTKVRLIKFFHEKMGFEVLAFENGFMECSLAWDQIKKGSSVESSLKNTIYPLWSRTQEFAPLYPYIEKKVRSASPLIVTGFDPQLPNIAKTTRSEILREFDAYLKSKNRGLGDSTITQNFVYNFNSLESNRQPYDSSIIKKMSFPLFKITLKKIVTDLTAGTEPEDIRWNLFFNSTLAYLPELVARTKSLSEFHDSRVNGDELRDSVMAVNLMDIARRLYPGKKIIVWAASSHISKNFSKNMGHFLEKRFPETIYTIGFTTSSGSFRQFTTNKNERLPEIKTGSFEHLFLQTDKQNFFMDLKTNSQTKKGKWLTDERIMRPFGYVDVSRDWTKNFDGIIFNKKMQPSHMVKY